MGSAASSEGEARAPLAALLRARLMLGLYCSAPLRLRMRSLARIYCLALPYTLNIIFIVKVTSIEGLSIISFLPSMLEYNINVLFSMLSDDTELILFCEEIHKIDLEMEVNAPLITPATKYIAISICAQQVFLVTANIYLYTYRIFLNWIAFCLIFTSFASLFNSVTRIIPLELSRHRLKMLRLNLEADLKGYSWNNQNKVHQIKAIKTCLKTYKHLIDNLEMNYKWIKILICSSCVFGFWKFLLIGKDLIWSFKTSAFSDLLGRSLLGAAGIIACVMSCFPAVFGELVTSEVDKLKEFIGNQALLCEDAAAGAALAQAASYLRRRPARVTLGRACALDAALVLTMASLYTTYFVVMLQFSGIM